MRITRFVLTVTLLPIAYLGFGLVGLGKGHYGDHGDYPYASPLSPSHFSKRGVVNYRWSTTTTTLPPLTQAKTFW